MMLKTLETLDHKKALNLLASANLALGLARSSHEINENNLVSNIISEARQHLNISSDNYDPEAIDRISDFLDQLSDQLLPEIDYNSAFSRLSKSGSLPSDLYVVNIIPNIENLYGKEFELEKELIQATVRYPDNETHYKIDESGQNPSGISFFSRTFRTKWPLKDFIELVVGERDQFNLTVHQSWRLFRDIIKGSPTNDPVDLLRQFANYFGMEITVNGVRGSFFEYANGEFANQIHFKLLPNKTIYSTHFKQYSSITNSIHSAFIVSIDQDKYQKKLKKMRVKRKDIYQLNSDHFSKLGESKNNNQDKVGAFLIK